METKKKVGKYEFFRYCTGDSSLTGRNPPAAGQKTGT